MKRLKNTSIILLLIISLFIPNINSHTLAENDAQDLGNILSNVEIMLGDKKIEDGDKIEIEDGSEIKLHFQYEIESGRSIKANDYARYKLPDAFTTVRDVQGDLRAGQEIIGRFYVDEDNYLVIEFNEKVDNKIDIFGEIVFLLNFKEEIFMEDVIQDIVFEEPVNLTFTAKRKPKENAFAIQKNGRYDKNINPTKIIWEIYINTELNEIKEARIFDEIPEGLFLIEDSISINHVQVGLDGRLMDGEEFVEFEKESLNPLILNLGDIDSAYKLVFETSIDYESSGSKSHYINKGILKSEDVTVSESTASLEKVEKEAMIQKKGWADKNAKDSQYIYWNIDVNLAQANLSEAILKDVMPEGLVVEEITVVELVPEGSEWKETENIVDTLDSFPIDLGAIESAYRIKVKSKIEDYDFYLKNNEFENKAVFEFDGQQEEASDKVVVERSPLLTKDGKEETNYDETKFSWTIKVNSAKQNMKNVVLTDSIPEGLVLVHDSIKIYSDKNEDVTDKYVIEKGDNQFVINFEDISETFTVKYDTSIIDETIKNFTNRVELDTGGLSGDGIDEDGKITYEKDVTQTVMNRYSKSVVGRKPFEYDGILYDGINYEEKTISWVFEINAIKREIKEMTFIDTFEPQDSMFLIPDTLVIVGSDNNVISPLAFEDNGIDGFTFKLENLKRGKYFVYYKTSIDADWIADKGGQIVDNNPLINQMKYYGTTIDQNKKEHTEKGKASDSVSLNQSYLNSGSKEGTLDRNNRKISWSVFFNELEEDLKGNKYKIIDSFSTGQELIEDSIKVYEYKLYKDGRRKVSDTPIDDDYEIVILEDNEFEIVFENGIDKSLVLKYDTKIIGVSKENYTNTAKIVDDKGSNREYDASVRYENHDQFITKETTNIHGNEVYLDEEIHWELNLNESLSEIKSARVIDEISEGHILLENSVEVKIGDGEFETYDYELDEDGLTLTIELGDIDQRVKIRYTTVVVKEGPISNNAKFVGNGEEVTQVSKREFTSKSTSWGTGNYRFPGKITLTKVDENCEPINHPAEFKLYYLLNGKEQIVGGENVKTNNKGVVQFVNLPFRTYYLEEVSAPKGYDVDSTIHEIVLDSKNTHFEYSFPNKRTVVDISVEKEWINGPETRPEVKVQLLRDGEPFGEVITLDETMQYVWKDLNQTDKTGREYEYTVKEVNLSEHYEAEVIQTDTYDFKITNTYIIPKTEYSVTKMWVDGPNDKPNVLVQLYQDDKAYGEPVLIEDTYTWKDLDKTDLNGVLHTYSVREVEVPENYQPSYVDTDEGTVITNTYVSPKVDISVEKEWINGPETRPEVKVQLLRDGEPFGEVITLDETMQYVWKDLNQTDKTGREYEYTVKEVDLSEHYEAEVIQTDTYDFKITNTYIIPKIDFTVDKVWVGGSIKGYPDIEVVLMRNGEVIDKITLSETQDWSYTWTGLDATDELGEVYEYSVDEITEVDGYTKSIHGNTIVNTYEKKVLGTALPTTGSPSVMLPSLGLIGVGLGLLIKSKKKDD